MQMTHSKLPELNELMELVNRHENLFRTQVLTTLSHKGQDYPVMALSMGSEDPTAPAYVLVGGVHGLERIGSRVIIAYLESIAQRVRWSTSLQEQLKKIRILSIPIVNPIGMLLQWRSNGNQVDLMRNAPIESAEALPFFGGQRIAKFLPFYRGDLNSPMESELQGIERFLRAETFEAKSVILLDVHSGFGRIDRVWFPYAHSKHPYPKFPEAAALIHNFELGYPHHPYHFEPQSKSYCTHGDFWDYLFDEFEKENAGTGRVMMNLTLEMGSWLWVKKNPLQAFSFLGAFDPIMPHRKKRVLRRHFSFLDFLRESVYSFPAWMGLDAATSAAITERARLRWY